MAEKAQPAPVAAPATEQKLNQVALWAMITGVAGLTVGWLVPLPWSVAAVILGHIGLSQIKRGVGYGRGYAIAGLATGYSAIGLVILALMGLIGLVAMSSPAEIDAFLNQLQMGGDFGGGFPFDDEMGPGMMNP